ncbi:Protein SCO1-like protein, mitochondrial, partial [Frankliniella fusca]
KMALSLLRSGALTFMRQTPQTRLFAPLQLQRLSPSLLRWVSNEAPDPKKPVNAALPKIEPKMGQNKTAVSWKNLGISAVLFGILLNALWYLKKVRQEEIEKKKVLSIGKAAIGGDFELIDTSKKVVSNKDFFGKWVLIYFGFTHCPDICPEELEKMAEVVDIVDKSGNVPFQPLFISVDPERDTPELIAKYTADFHKRLLGLTGSIDQIKDVCKKYRIYYSAGPKEDGDYIVDHTIIMYLLNPKGEFQQYYGRNKTAAEISRDIFVRVSMYKED